MHALLPLQLPMLRANSPPASAGLSYQLAKVGKLREGQFSTQKES